MTKNRSNSSLDVVHSGMVLISDGKGRGKLSKLLLTKELLYIQIPVDSYNNSNDSNNINTLPRIPSFHQKIQPPTNFEGNDFSTTTRTITIQKKSHILGISIKGGVDETATLPIVISKIAPNTPADECTQLYIGDIILEINGTSVDGKTHDDVVKMLKDIDTTVTLTVKSCPQIAPILRTANSEKVKTSHSISDIFTEPLPFKSALKSSVSVNDIKSNAKSYDEPILQGEGKDGWKTINKLPLPMAQLSRYLWGTDKIRNNAFELRTVDGRTSNIIHCEDKKAVEQWIKQIQNHINNLNHKSMKISNKFLHVSEKIQYIGWADERIPDVFCDDIQVRWKGRFIILKGTDFCIFESPPLNSDDLNNKCLFMYKIIETVMKTAIPKRDRRDYVLEIETADGGKHYLSFNSFTQLQTFESAYYDSIYKSIKATQCKTFACSFLGRPSGLVIHLVNGISLYDIPTKQYIWNYKFSDLENSSDDGKIRLHLVFKKIIHNQKEVIEVKDIECDQVINLIMTLHSFYIAKIMGVYPDYLKVMPLS
uniref:PDZ domain-containing protein n=1 Tax=Strongyloides stercoralis TaxID=6248 RepID=A0A0K0E3J8_STRER